MSDRRTVQITELPTEGSVRELHNFTYKILQLHPDAMLEYTDEYYDNSRVCATIQVDKTELDREIEAIDKLISSIRRADSYENEVVIHQNTPIPPEVLAPYHEDKTKDYTLHMNGRMLVRMLSLEEIQDKRWELIEKQEVQNSIYKFS